LANPLCEHSGQLPKVYFSRRTRMSRCKGDADACEIDLAPKVKYTP
jgi:hypothetical protein